MITRRLATGLFGCALLTFVLGGSAAAQEPRGLFQVLGGVTSTANEKPFFGGTLGGRLTGWLELSGEFGKMQDVVPPSVRDRVIGLGGTDPRVPAIYGLVHLRFIQPHGVVRPFVSAGAGFAQLLPQGGEGAAVTVALFPADNRSKPAVALGGGLRFGFGSNVDIDAGYRYLRIYSDYQIDTNTSNDKVLTNVSCVYGALGIRF